MSQSQPERAFDTAVAYHQHVFATGLTTIDDLWQAAVLAHAVADAVYTQAAEAASKGQRLMFLRAGDKARSTRDGHQLAAELIAEINAIGEHVLGGTR